MKTDYIVESAMTNRDIANYIIKEYPDSCIAKNDVMYHYDEEDLVDELVDFFAYELIGICGCGCPEDCLRSVKEYLRILKNYKDEPNFELGWQNQRDSFKNKFGIEYVYDNSLLLFMAYILDNKNLTEHGSSIGGAWITKLGEICLAVLEQADLGD